MLKINKKVEYALMCLQYMASLEEGTRCSAKELSEKLHIPFDPVSRVLQLMSKNEILASSKGIAGGYKLIKSMTKITVVEVARIVDPIDAEDFCSGKSGMCDHFDNCSIVTPMNKLNNKIFHLLNDIHLSDLFLLNQSTELNHA